MKNRKHVFYGHNSYRKRSGGVVRSSLHAEVDVILKSRKILSKKGDSPHPSTIYVARIGKYSHDLPSHIKHQIRIAMPCMDCQKELYEYNVTRIYYTDIINDEDVLVEMKMV